MNAQLSALQQQAQQLSESVTRPIPGSRKIANLDDNIDAVDIPLTQDDRTRIADAMSGVQGARYAEREMAMLPQR